MAKPTGFAADYSALAAVDPPAPPRAASIGRWGSRVIGVGGGVWGVPPRRGRRGWSAFFGRRVVVPTPPAPLGSPPSWSPWRGSAPAPPLPPPVRPAQFPLAPTSMPWPTA